MLRWLRERLGKNGTKPDVANRRPKYWVPPRGGYYSPPDDAPLHPRVPETRSGLSPLPK
jgi:hypothetical protein